MPEFYLCMCTGLVHGDFNFPNLVFDPESKQLKAVLDWEMACVGDVTCDLAEFLMCLLKPSEFVDGGLAIGLPQGLTCKLCFYNGIYERYIIIIVLILITAIQPLILMLRSLYMLYSL